MATDTEQVVSIALTLPQLGGLALTMLGFFWGLVKIIIGQYKKEVEKELANLADYIGNIDEKFLEKLLTISEALVPINTEVIKLREKVAEISTSLAVARDRLSRRND